MAREDRQAALDARIQDWYGARFDESERLASPSSTGALELRRTLEVVLEHCAAGRVVDVGGGPGALARALLDEGFDVELVDPVPTHVARASERGVRARIGDARRLPFDDGGFDAALLLGPLYHLVDRAERLRALREAARTVRPGGAVFAGAISRFARFGALHLEGAEPPAQLAALLADGVPPPALPFPAGHFHTAAELGGELADAGLEVLRVVGLEGPAGRLLDVVRPIGAAEVEAALVLARRAAEAPALRELSLHLLAVGVVPPR